MPEIVQQLKPLVLSELNPPLKVTLIENEAGIVKLREYFVRKTAKQDFVLGLDCETNITQDFWFRRIRTVQLGDRDEQFVIDLLAFAGSEEKLSTTQGNYGANAEGIYKAILDVLSPVLDSNTWLKCGVNLAFDYEALRWNLGVRTW